MDYDSCFQYSMSTLKFHFSRANHNRYWMTVLPELPERKGERVRELKSQMPPRLRCGNAIAREMQNVRAVTIAIAREMQNVCAVTIAIADLRPVEV